MGLPLVLDLGGGFTDSKKAGLPVAERAKKNT